MKIAVVLGGLMISTAALAQPPTIAQIRGAYAVCDGHLHQASSGGPISSRPLLWDGGFEHCAVLKKALDDDAAAKSNANAIAASKAVADKLAHTDTR